MKKYVVTKHPSFREGSDLIWRGDKLDLQSDGFRMKLNVDKIEGTLKDWIFWKWIKEVYDKIYTEEDMLNFGVCCTLKHEEVNLKELFGEWKQEKAKEDE